MHPSSIPRVALACVGRECVEEVRARGSHDDSVRQRLGGREFRIENRRSTGHLQHRGMRQHCDKQNMRAELGRAPIKRDAVRLYGIAGSGVEQVRRDSR